jgi:hypothetical protein
MSQNLILNKNNIVPNTSNTVLRYNFPRTTEFKDMEIGVKSIDMYNSIFNINASLYNNNIFQYFWFNSAGNLATLFNITIPDGYYDVSSIDEYLKSQLILRSHCLVDSTGTKYYFFLKISNNINRYAVQLDTIKTFTDSQALAGVTIGGTVYNYPATRVNNWKFHATSTFAPRFKFLTTNAFNTLVGFNQQEYPTSTQNTSQSFLSESAPVQEPVSSILVLCNLVKNTLVSPENIMHSFILNSEFGYINNERPSEITYNTVIDNTYSNIEIRLLDQDLKQIQIQDPQILISLLLRKKQLQ